MLHLNPHWQSTPRVPFRTLLHLTTIFFIFVFDFPPTAQGACQTYYLYMIVFISYYFLVMIAFVSKDKGSTGSVWSGRRWCFQVKWLIYLRVSLEALSAQPLSRETAASFSSEDQYTHTFPKGCTLQTAANPHSIQWISLQVDNGGPAVDNRQHLVPIKQQMHFSIFLFKYFFFVFYSNKVKNTLFGFLCVFVFSSHIEKEQTGETLLIQWFYLGFIFWWRGNEFLEQQILKSVNFPVEGRWKERSTIL